MAAKKKAKNAASKRTRKTKSPRIPIGDIFANWDFSDLRPATAAKLREMLLRKLATDKPVSHPDFPGSIISKPPRKRKKSKPAAPRKRVS